jgi:hypothetical protein
MRILSKGAVAIVAGLTLSSSWAEEKTTSGLNWEFSLNEGYNSNVTASGTNPIESFFTEIDAGIRGIWQGARGKLELGLGGGFDYYYSSDLEENLFPSAVFYGEFSYELSSRTRLMADTSTEFLSQPNFTLSPGGYQNQGDYFISSSMVGVEHQWRPKIATITMWEADIYGYTESFYQEQLGRIEQTGSNQLLFLWKPTTSLVQEYRINPRTYFNDSSMDSLGQFFLLGFNQQINPKSTITGRFGLEQRWLNEPGGGEGHYLGPYGEIGAKYAAGRMSFDLLARYGTQSSGLVGVGESDSLSLGASVSRRLGAKTKVGLYGNYQYNQFDQQQTTPSFNDSVYDIGVSLERRVGKRINLEIGASYAGVVSSGDEQGTYNRWLAFIGAKIDL